MSDLPSNFDRIVDRFYSAATGDATWDEALCGISDTIGSNYAFFQEQHLPSGASTRFMHSGTVPLEGVAAYFDHWIEMDPRLDFALRNPREEIYHDHQLVQEDDGIYGSPFYNEFLLPFELQYFAATSIPSSTHYGDPDRVVYLGINQRRTAGHVSSQNCAFLIALRSHLSRALAIEAKLGAVNADMALLKDTLNTLSCGIVILDRFATVVWANETALKIIDRRRCIGVERGRLQATAGQARRQLGAFIADACHSHDDSKRLPGGSILLQDHDPEPLEILVAPLPKNSAKFADVIGGSGRHAVCFLSEPAYRTVGREEVLRAIFDLTPSEAQLAVALTDEDSLQAAAKLCGLTYESARTIIKKVYAKTGTNSQAQLVRRVLRGPLSLVRRDVE